ncbi:Sodium/hydrogen exchanger family-domain-containing protein [Aspergillus karnatakaensis]|uniref:cation:proton antiporter n=1 Tax=Aspergillus karnatakaensis TaxID=1810916 RepID=UPI003CCDE54A
MAGAESAFAYHEPTIYTILNQTGLLLVLNIVNTCLDKLLYCGLIGQLFIGILWGTPGAKWLDRETETVIQQLGYLGLIMLVYEGGLSTSMVSLRANMYLSLAVALTGIALPMGLSFILMELVSATPLQAFSAGAALSATSLGTTFTILSTTQLIATRLGTVTTSAAMLDDVIGLVMVQIISNLGGSGDSFSAVTVVRPLFVSIGFGVGVVLACRFVLRPIINKVLGSKVKFPDYFYTPQFAFLGYTALLVGLVAGGTYAGTSSLFAAYLAGVVTSWFDSLVRASRHAGNEQAQPAEDTHVATLASASQKTSQPNQDQETVTGSYIYEHYYHGPVTRILIPMFFASIGFAIPITEMFQGSVVWRGVVYAILMTFGKVCTGLWLVRFSPLSGLTAIVRIVKTPLSYARSCIRRPAKPNGKKESRSVDNDRVQDPIETSDENTPESATVNSQDEAPADRDTTQPPPQDNRPASVSSLPPKPKSLYPASILSLAMVARGEIGYLIASLAESNGIFGETSDGSSSETYLVVVWAISLCTLIGPISVGTLVKRVKALQAQRANTGGPDPLGVWGI